MVRIIPLAEAKAHFSEIVPRIPDRYEAAIKRATWRDPAIAGEPLFKEAMTVVITEERRRKGIEKWTDENWRGVTVEKGKPIIGTRISARLDQWAANWTPYRAAIEAVELPPKVIDWATNIDQRVKPIVKALVEKKKGIVGVSS